METLIANLKHAARSGKNTEIGGGVFTPDELRQAVEQIEQARTAGGGPRQPVSFSVTRAEALLIAKILARCEQAGVTDPADRLRHDMNLSACIAQGCPLDLERMADWPRMFDVGHDVIGIDRHIDRDTGTLQGHFLPRFRRHTAATTTTED